MIIELKRVIYGVYVTRWCKLPYQGHIKGCPRYGTRKSCPPEAPMFDEIAEAPYYLVIQEFDLEAQEAFIRQNHENWSSKMCRNPRYWQKSLMNKILNEARAFLWGFPEGIVLTRPEANGVNLFSTCRIHGIKLEKNPQVIVKKMVIIAKRKI